MKFPIISFNARWLLEADQAMTTQLALGSLPWQTYLFPDGLGHGGFEKEVLALGMSVFRGEHIFTPQAVGRMISLAEFEVEFSEPTFQVQVMRGGRTMQREQIPPLDLTYCPGNDLFRLAQQIRQTPLLDGSSNSTMLALTLGASMLKILLGEALADQLLTKLGLVSCPMVQVRPIPLHVTKPLLTCLPTGMRGDLRKLFCQAEVLEYLTLLVQHATLEQPQSRPERRRKKAHEVREYLMSLEGGLPAMSTIAQMFDRPARSLNDEFTQEYGESIFTFITRQRLEAARQAILDSDMSLKQLAHKLGYSHVNNFSAAFTKRYGYGPASLRKGRLVK